MRWNQKTFSEKTFSDKWIECRIHADLASLPAEMTMAIPLLKSLPYLAFAAFWCVASLLLLSDASKDGPAGALFGLFFVAVGVIMLVHFSGPVGAQQYIRFDERTVGVHNTSWFRPARTWQKPYTDFEGVVMRQCKTSADNHTTYHQVIELLHADPNYIVPLYIQPEISAPRKILQTYADRLHLPARRAASNAFASIEPFSG